MLPQLTNRLPMKSPLAVVATEAFSCDSESFESTNGCGRPRQIPSFTCGEAVAPQPLQAAWR